MSFSAADKADVPRLREDMKRFPPGTLAIDAVALNFSEDENVMLPRLRAVSCDVIMRTCGTEKALEIALYALDLGIPEVAEIVVAIEGAVEFIEAEDAAGQA